MKRPIRFLFIQLVSLASLTACGQSEIIPFIKSDIQDKNIIEQKKTEVVQEQPLIEKNDELIEKRQKITEIGDGKFIGQLKNNIIRHEPDVEGDITLNFQGTDINEFIKVILGDIFNYNFIVDPKVSGSVTIDTTKPLNKKELFPLLEEILSINGAAIIEKKGMFQILPKENIAKGNLSLSSSTAERGYSVKIIPLEYIAAKEMKKILKPFTTENSDLRIDKQRNMIIIGGTAHELAQLQETIDIFDVDWLRGMSVGLYPLDYIDPKTLKAEMDEILGDTSTSSDSDLLSGLARTVALERLNSILLISSTPSALREAEIWLYRLDRPGEQVGQNLYVYNVQNSKAIEIAEILSNIFGNTKTATSLPIASPLQLAPGTTPVEISANNPANTPAIPPTTPVAPTTTLSVGESGLSLLPESSVEIIADDTRNALVILASARDYKMVAAAIEKLDVIPLQVLIEASILEVTLNDDLSYGVEWFFNNTIGNNRQGQGQLDLGDAGLAAIAPGFSYTIINSASNIKVALNALATESEVNVLSAPSLMVLDNQTATINVGDEIPIPTRQSTSNIDPDAPTVNEIQFRNTGVTLTVTPRVNNGGLVTMEIKQEVSNAVDTTSSDIDAPTIQQRQIESTVAINSGQTIVLGGLIQDTETDNESGIPGLYKLPVIGKLFGQTSIEKRRTELVVLLTPRVVRNELEAKHITNEFRRKLENLSYDAKEI